MTVRKNSKKRNAIIEYLKGTTEHPSAEMVYEKLKPVYTDLSLGTVYRNLAMLREDGEIICVGKLNGKERFDADTSLHAHFACKNCGTVSDIFLDDGTKKIIKELAPEEMGEVESCTLTYYGTCEQCAEK